MNSRETPIFHTSNDCRSLGKIYVLFALEFYSFCVHASEISVKKSFTVTFCRLASETEISENC